MNSIRISKTSILVATVAMALFAFLASAGISAAATYAYVNNEGIVMTVVANDPNTAIETAPNRTPRSGVMLISGSSDATLVGDEVDGV